MTATAPVLPADWPASLPAPADGAADLWILRVPEEASAALDLSVLDEHERRRASSFVKDRDRHRYTMAHLTLRRLLGAYLGVPAEAVRFHSEPCPCCGGPHGRPAVARAARTPLHFSLSHGGDLVLVGVASVPIGVDVEALPELEVVAELGAALHHAETREVEAASPEDSRSVFARLWVRKEAYLKGIGTGLGRDLDLDYLGEDPAAGDAPPGWRIVNLLDLPDHAAAAALHTRRTVPPSIRWLDPSSLGTAPEPRPGPTH
ncbi:4'-phosphopantetheinyl transferase superfamily protein [Streptomyces sp. NPDC046712]|uniref:4'-phosphopantetheinyl transferase family protein n=1 Tax=Streptomyces sp. NPDC046712 TaxID=3154802 RepID=UPI0033CC19D6